ncbi:MAG: nucleotidyltransferase domain-containing protein [Defluviitaleaceae bacterium]|nr:nucleotidyltransferase domain-containing protein [Defluviitaleaceae bacterium]
MRTEVAEFLDMYVNRFKMLGLPVDALVLFGSQARNTATISSDIDIAVVMNDDLSPYDRGQLLNLGSEIDMRYDVDLFFTNKSALKNASGCFDTNKYIREEGVVLWQS